MLDSGDRIRFFFEEEAFEDHGRLQHSKAPSINKVGHALHDLDPAFAHFLAHPELAGLVSHLGIAAPLLLQSVYNFKQPLIGGEVIRIRNPHSCTPSRQACSARDSRSRMRRP